MTVLKTQQNNKSGASIFDAQSWVALQPKQIETEWLNTKVLWYITEHGSSSRIEMQHQGLTPELLCYDDCEAGWDIFFLVASNNISTLAKVRLTEVRSGH